MPDVIGIDWSKVWTGDDMSLVLTATQRAWLLQLASNLYVAPKLFFTPFEDTDLEEINDAIQLLQASLLNTTTPPKENMNNRILLIPSLASVISGNRMTVTGIYTHQNTAANGDNFEWYEGLNLAAGTWHTRIHVMRISSSAKIKVEVSNLLTSASIDSDTYDAYNATQVDAHVNLNNFTLTEDTFIKIKVTADGKNASSSNYLIYMAALELYRD